MRRNFLYLLNAAAVFFLACMCVGVGFAQTPTPTPTAALTVIGVRKGKDVIPLKDALTDENGRKVLVIDKNEVVRLSKEDGVQLKSLNENSVRILDNEFLVGINEDTEAEILIEKGGARLRTGDVDKLIVRVQDADASRQIVAQSTFLTYKTVKDNFGKKFAQSYFVVQVDIRNEKLDKQFIVQTVDVIIDPNQCANGRQLYEDFDEEKCFQIFTEYFKFPNAQTPVRREEVIGAGKADLNRSNRNVAFRILSFSASMGTILTGFNGVLGPDGVKGVNVLGTTVTTAANGLFPNTADEKLENLKNAIPGEDVVIKSKESRIFNIFIPTDRVFWSESWQKYIQPARDSDKDTYMLKVVLDMLMLSTATGVLVDNDAPKVEVKSDDDLLNKQKKFNIVNRFKTTSDAATKITRIRNEFADNLNPETRRKIINALNALNNKAAGGKITLTAPIAFNENQENTKALFGKLEAAIEDAFQNALKATRGKSSDERAKALEQTNNEILQALEIK
jgi:hypothetical protein